jgi:hypothetical protein
MGRFRNSIEIIKASWAVLQQDRELVWLPVISVLSTAATAALFMGGFWVTSSRAVDGTFQASPLGWILVAAMYLVLAFITIYFNTALISAAWERMHGGDPTLGSAFAAANSKIGLILPWAIVSATVSIVIRAVEQRAGIFGRVIGAVVGVAWSLVTFLVLPVIVVEGLGVGAALKRAGALFKKTWGEQVIGNAAIGILGFVGLLVAAPVVMLAIATKTAIVIVPVIALAVAWLLGVTAVTSAMSGIFQTALYQFASTGEVPAGFTREQMTGAFRPRQQTLGRVGFGRGVGTPPTFPE